MQVRIVPSGNTTPGKLAEAELHFSDQDGALAGLKLIGFAIWERRDNRGHNVTFPARSYQVGGERRSFALVRPIVDASSTDRIKTAILVAFQDYQDQADGAVYTAQPSSTRPAPSLPRPVARLADDRF